MCRRHTFTLRTKCRPLLGGWFRRKLTPPQKNYIDEKPQLIDDKSSRTNPKPRSLPMVPRVASLTPRTEQKYKDIDEKFAKYKQTSSALDTGSRTSGGAAAGALAPRPTKRIDISSLRVHIPSPASQFPHSSGFPGPSLGGRLSPGRLPISTPALANA